METKKRRVSQARFKEIVSYVYGGNFKVLGTFVDVGAPVEVKCLTCGEVKGILADTLISGKGICVARCTRPTNPSTITVRRAERCAGGNRPWRKPALKSFNAEAGEVAEYFHGTCGRTSEKPPFEFNGELRCALCFGVFRTNSSAGETRIAKILSTLNVKYTREHTFEYLGRKRFDFFIPSLNVAIEFDGGQHFKAIEHWGGEDELKRTQESDALKNDFCDFMGIDLLRIPYWEFDNIDEIVTNFIDTVKYMNAVTNRKEA